MNLVKKLGDELKIVLGRKLSKSQMRGAKKVGYLDVKDNPGNVVDVDGFFMKYKKIALKELHPDDETPLIKTIASSYNSNGLLYHEETIIETAEGCRRREIDYFPAGCFFGIPRRSD
jgi:hypothetical protein